MLKVKADLKAELLKPRYRDAFGPALSAVLIEQGLAAQLCNSLYEQEKKLERELAAEGAQLGRALARPPAVSSLRASSSPLPDPEPTREELSVVSAIRDRWAAQLHATSVDIVTDASDKIMMHYNDVPNSIPRTLHAAHPT